MDISENLKNELRTRNLNDVFCLVCNTNGKEEYATYPPTERDIKQMRLETLVEKMDNGNAEMTPSENAEAEEIMEFLGYNKPWYPPCGINRGKL
jgi:hypothetical protein